MTIIVKKYGRWNESANWQLEIRKEKDIDEDAFEVFKECGGFVFSERNNEFHAISEDRQRMIVVSVLK